MKQEIFGEMKWLLTIVSTMMALTLTAAPTLEVTSEVIYEGTSVAKGTVVEYARFTVTASELSGSVDVYITGTHRNMFTIETTTIQNGVTDIIVSYKPASVGKHTARINFDATRNQDLSCGYSINAVCIDPANPPTIEVGSSSLTQFQAEVGKTQMQQFTVVTKGLPDYGSVKVAGKVSGAFVLSTTTLMKEATTQVKITFAPKTEGTFTDTILVSALEAELVSFVIVGVCGSGRDPEQTEGDNLPLSVDNPLSEYTTSFDGVVRNKLLALDGWKNLAVKGTRAWWGYDFEGNACAKATPFDSFVPQGQGTECQMMLVSPALNYKDAKTQLLKFRIMGQFLYDGMPDVLDVCYIEPDGDDLYVEPIQVGVPCTADESGTWLDLEVHLENQNLADVFFIGFRFTSTRGSDNSATYYVDDFSWGIGGATSVSSTFAARIPQSEAFYTLDGRAASVLSPGKIYIQPSGIKRIR